MKKKSAPESKPFKSVRSYIIEDHDVQDKDLTDKNTMERVKKKLLTKFQQSLKLTETKDHTKGGKSAKKAKDAKAKSEENEPKKLKIKKGPKLVIPKK